MRAPLRFALVLLVSATALALADVLAFAHDIGYPHQDPPPQPKSGGGASPVLILGGVALTLALVALLIWVKQRTVDRGDEDAASPSTERLTPP